MNSIFDKLEVFKCKGLFVYNPGQGDNLSKVCNVPKDNVSGIYLVFADSVDDDHLIYIGISGIVTNGVFNHRLGGMRERLISGKQKDKYGNRDARRNIWKKMMADDNITELHIKWYITYDDEIQVIPRQIEQAFLEILKDQNGYLPLWNKNT
jgi:hypothetical protein